MIKFLSVLASLLLCLVPLSADDTNAAPAATAKVLAPSNDVGLTSDGVATDMDSYQVRIGELHSPGGEAYILPFRLPVLAAGQRFANVHLRMQLAGLSKEANGVLANADLYGLVVRDNAKPLPTDYYQGSKPDSKATLLQANFLTPASTVRTNADTGPFVETSSDGDVALTKFFNDSMQPGIPGKYLFLRISYDADTIPSGNNAYNVLTTGADGDNESPIITYTVAPAATK
jgi:hypothetical protein